MKCCILDACYPDGMSGAGLAALWLKHYCQLIGIEIAPPGAADVLLVTCVDPRNADFIAKVKRWFCLPVIAGGAGALSPHHLGLVADVVCCGDGRRTLDTLKLSGMPGVKNLPESWVHGQTRPVEIRSGFPWDAPPIQAEDGAYRLWCGRGCRKKCFFCQTGWACEYEENPSPDRLISTAKKMISDGNSIAYLSNDPSQHSFHDRLPPVMHGSYSVEYLRKYGAPSARQIRLGVEGVSSRVRSWVGKPISQQDLVGCTSWLNGLGKSVRWFMIAGIPGETDEDWAELRETVLKWKMVCLRGVLALSFTAWQPEPATPMGILPVEDSYWKRFCDFRDWFFTVGWSNRIKLMAPASPTARMESAIARMGLPVSALRAGGSWGPNDRVKYPGKVARNTIGARLLKELKEVQP